MANINGLASNFDFDIAAVETTEITIINIDKNATTENAQKRSQYSFPSGPKK